jgi:hypothetical protein
MRRRFVANVSALALRRPANDIQLGVYGSFPLFAHKCPFFLFCFVNAALTSSLRQSIPGRDSRVVDEAGWIGWMAGDSADMAV